VSDVSRNALALGGLDVLAIWSNSTQGLLVRRRVVIGGWCPFPQAFLLNVRGLIDAVAYDIFESSKREHIILQIMASWFRV